MPARPRDVAPASRSIPGKQESGRGTRLRRGNGMIRACQALLPRPAEGAAPGTVATAPGPRGGSPELCPGGIPHPGTAWPFPRLSGGAPPPPRGPTRAAAPPGRRGRSRPARRWPAPARRSTGRPGPGRAGRRGRAARPPPCPAAPPALPGSGVRRRQVHVVEHVLDRARWRVAAHTPGIPAGREPPARDPSHMAGVKLGIRATRGHSPRAGAIPQRATHPARRGCTPPAHRARAV